MQQPLSLQFLLAVKLQKAVITDRPRDAHVFRGKVYQRVKVEVRNVICSKDIKWC